MSLSFLVNIFKAFSFIRPLLTQHLEKKGLLNTVECEIPHKAVLVILI